MRIPSPVPKLSALRRRRASLRLEEETHLVAAHVSVESPVIEDVGGLGLEEDVRTVLLDHLILALRRRAHAQLESGSSLVRFRWACDPQFSSVTSSAVSASVATMPSVRVREAVTSLVGAIRSHTEQVSGSCAETWPPRS